MINSDKEIFEKLYNPLCYFAFELVNNKDIAEDLVQDAFCAYLDRKNEIGVEEFYIKAYLYKTIRNKAYNLGRRDKAAKRYLDQQDILPIDDIDYEQGIIMAEFMSHIHTVVQSLPEGCQKVFKMSYFDGLSNKEICDHLSISINTVKTQKLRALAVLRKKLPPTYFSILLLFDLF